SLHRAVIRSVAEVPGSIILVAAILAVDRTIGHVHLADIVAYAQNVRPGRVGVSAPLACQVVTVRHAVKGCACAGLEPGAKLAPDSVIVVRYDREIWQQQPFDQPGRVTGGTGNARDVLAGEGAGRGSHICEPGCSVVSESVGPSA